MATINAHESVSMTIELGRQLTITADAAGTGLVQRYFGHSTQLDTTPIGVDESMTLGGYFEPIVVRVTCLTGVLTTTESSNTAAALSGDDAGSGTVTSVNLTQPAAGITVSGGPITTSGSITLALTNDLAAVEGLATTGVVRRTASNTWSAGTEIATAEIANDAVTYAKMQNVSATDKVLGRSTSGAGDVEEITCTSFARSLLDDAAASDARTTLELGTVATLAVDTDTTLAANSDVKVASQKAIKAYADALIAANDAMQYKGVVDCSTNPNYPAADAGHTYKVSVAGKIGGGSGTNVEAGDMLLCITDATASGTQAAVGAYWNVIQVNIDGAVIGPASSVNNRVAFFSGTSGKLIADSGLTLAGTNTGDETTTTAGALINGATSKTTPVDADYLGLMDSAASNILKKLSWANLKAAIWTALGALIAAGTQKSTPVDADMLAIADSAASNATKYSTLANLRTGLQGDGLTSAQSGFRNVPQNSQSAAYTTVAADSGKHILHPSADTTARTFTIDSNANVAYPVGTAITFINENSAGTVTIAITSDTMRLAGAGTTGSRTLAANGIATAVKVTSTSWIISGTNLT